MVISSLSCTLKKSGEDLLCFKMDKEASLCALAALKRDATEEDNFKLMVLFQQCSNRLREVEATGFSEAELGDIPGFSEFVICAIKKKFESKRKTGEEQDRGGPKKKLKGKGSLETFSGEAQLKKTPCISTMNGVSDKMLL